MDFLVRSIIYGAEGSATKVLDSHGGQKTLNINLKILGNENLNSFMEQKPHVAYVRSVQIQILF